MAPASETGEVAGGLVNGRVGGGVGGSEGAADLPWVQLTGTRPWT